MTTYFTKEPLGSTSPYVLFDNSQNLDYALNDITKAIWTDRFGRSRKSYWGMEQAFSAQLLSQQQRFNTFIQSSGYKVIGEYTAGPMTVTDYNQLVRYQNELYKLTSATSLPFTTTGNDAASWVNDSTHFVSVGDAALRQELAAPGGAGLVGGIAKPVTWSGFAGGADPTGITDSTAAFLAANATKSKIYIPAGSYLLSQDVVSDPLTSWEMEMGAGFSGSFRLRQVPWLAGATEQIFHYLERMSRNTFIAPTDGVGVFGSAHNDGAGSAGAAIAVAGMAYNDNTVGPGGGAWSIYGTTVRNAGTTGPSHGMELDIANRGNEQEIYPFNMFRPGMTTGIWLGSGGELGGADQPDNLSAASVGIALISNDGHPEKKARFLKGIVFQSTSLKGTDGVTGEGIAMALANRHTLQWYGDTNGRLGAITCQSTDVTKAMRINLSDSGVLIQKTTGGQTLFSVEATVNTPANFPVVRSGIAGNPVQLAASGSDTNVDLLLAPKGTGNLNVSANIAPQSANTYTIGTTVRPWAGGFIQTAFTVTSDEHHKTKSPPLLAKGTLDFVISSNDCSMQSSYADKILDAWSEVDFVQFQYLDRVEEKGEDGARWHFGVIAQRAKEAFERHGLDAHRFGFLCYDEWDDQHVKVQINEGVMVTKTRMVEVPVAVTRTRIVSKPLMITALRDALKDEVLADGTRIKRVVKEEFQTPKMELIPVLNEDGSPNEQTPFVSAPVMEDVEEEYTATELQDVEEEHEEPAEPEYEDVLVTPASSRYGIRYEEALVLEAALQRRNYEKLRSLIEEVEGSKI